MSSDPLAPFTPATRRWFGRTFRAPTPPQVMGWPAILRGEHTLILSPTGSGKTMAAFLCGIDAIYRGLADDPDLPGVQLLYVSPLKALNNDIERNLRVPLTGIRGAAKALGEELPNLRVAVRTGDTPQSMRQRMVTQPPHILITTPESLYLILTSPKARDILRPVRTVIVDEIHTLCGNKRGVHLGISLERLVELADGPVQRIGLSATQRPLDEVARFLGGQEWVAAEGGERLEPRPVTIVDAGINKPLDVEVVTVPGDLRDVPGGSIWPTVIPHVLNEVRRHRTTLIFANARRSAERAADRLNEQYMVETEEELEPGVPGALLVDGVAKGQGMFGTGRVGGPFRAHHGSISREVRLELEQQLKDGKLPALIGTSSLELGIDIGSVDVVLQLESPRSVARGLQRVGRSGHLVGQTSVGRIYALHYEDLLDAAAVARGMRQGDIEPTFTPRTCLDVLAQQTVAMVSVEEWGVADLHRLARRAYGYQDLSREALDAVLAMLAGTYSSELFRELRPRLVWDRVHDRLAALPGSRMLAISAGGTITDRGLFNVYLADRTTRLGTLDEEFVTESRVGDVFALGSNTWRVVDIDEDKVVVIDAAGATPRMPFWRGDAARREHYTGLRYGEFRRLLAERVAALPPLPQSPNQPFPPEAEEVVRWLVGEYALDEHSARNAIHYVGRQLEAVGAISTDRTVVVESFADALGDHRLVIHSCFGSRINSAWALALSHALRERYHMNLETQVSDDGILMRVLDTDRSLPADLVREMGPDEARRRILLELPDSAMFGTQFRMNAERALLLPPTRGRGRRTPFWLQRLRARDLLAAVRDESRFPIILETYRDCLRDVLDLDHLLDLLGSIQRGDVRVVMAETLIPSPVASALLFDFVSVAVYEGDLPRIERQMRMLAINRELLGELLADGSLPDLLRPEAVQGVEEELQHLADGYRARTAEELASLLQGLGDLTTEEVAVRCLGDGPAWVQELAAQGRVLWLDIPAGEGVEARWVAAEGAARYRDAFGLLDEALAALPEALREGRVAPDVAREALVRAYVRRHAPFTIEQLLARYALPADWAVASLEAMADAGQVVRGYLSPGTKEAQWCDRSALERIHRRTLAVLRREVQPVGLPALADFEVRWQGAHPAHRHSGAEGLREALEGLRGYQAPAVTWARDILQARVRDLRRSALDDLVAGGELVWVAEGADARRARAQLFLRGEGGLFLDDGDEALAALDAGDREVLDYLREEGSAFARDVRLGLGRSSQETTAALVRLALAGLVTNDRFEVLERIAGGEAEEPGRPLTSRLDADLATWRRSRGGPALVRPPKGRLHLAKRVAAERSAPPDDWPGRWSLVRSRGVLGPRLSPEERAERLARAWLQRYGIVTRACVAGESAGTWQEVYGQLMLLEMRGQVRRGYFVAGLPGVQYAAPEAVDALREWSAEGAEGVGDLVLLNACDPACVYGWPVGDSPDAAAQSGDGDAVGDRGETDDNSSPSFSSLIPHPSSFPPLPRLPSNYVVILRGVAVLSYAHGGARWQALESASEATVMGAVRLCLEHLTQEGGLCAMPRRVLVRSWNGHRPIGGPAQGLLERLGFRREPPAMVWDGL